MPSKSNNTSSSPLPIDAYKTSILSSIQSNDILLLQGSTGSGKSTKTPQFLIQKGFKVIITQPRRVAAITLAQRVSQELNCQLGQKVGYAIRFDKKMCNDTRILYCTDGWLLREAKNFLHGKTVIILDEFHERSVRTDLLLSIYLPLVKKGKCKLIISSATLETENLVTFLKNYTPTIPIINVPGKLFPVTTLYTVTPQADILHATMVTILQIHQDYPSGDVLVFLTGKEDILNLKKLFDDLPPLPSHLQSLLVLPFYAALESHLQSFIFSPTPLNTRKVILATNVAETSITIPNIYYVVDTGLAKVRGYNPKIGLDSLTVQPISKENAIQRMGRCGRIAPGTCFRLYTEKEYEKLPNQLPPEIHRVNLSSVILQLLELKLDPKTFPWLDPPSKTSLLRSFEQLFALGALSSQGFLTDLGNQMAKLPLDPSFSKSLIVSQELHCTNSMLGIVAMLSSDSQPDLQEWKHSTGDHLSLLFLYSSYKDAQDKKVWCREHKLKWNTMKNVQDIYTQLSHLLKFTSEEDELNVDAILKSLVAGHPTNIALLTPSGSYETPTRIQVNIHPSSTLFGQKPPCVVFEEMIWTNKMWIRGCSRIEIEWLIEMIPEWYGRLEK